MKLTNLLSELSERGIELWAENEQLRIRAPKGTLTAELQNQLAESKTELLKLLKQDSNKITVADLPEIVPEPENCYQPFPLTDMQHAFWVGRLGVLELGDVANHGYYEIEGRNLNVERLNWALQQLIERHDMLRSVMLPEGQQQVLKEVSPYEISIADLRGKADEDRDSEIEAVRAEMSHQVLPCYQWPLFEFRASILDEQRVRLHISYDLQIFDAWSMFRLFEEWFALCQNPQTVLKPLALTFRDYVLAEKSLQETEIYRRSRDYWLGRLDNFPPAPELPLAQNPATLKQHQCQRFSGKLDPEKWQQLKQRATASGMTPSGLLLAAFAEVLTVWSQNPKFTINLALFNRLPLHPQVNDILGDFTSVTLLAVDNSVREPFKQRALRLQQQLARDLEHRYFSGVSVMRELTRRQGGTPTAMPIVFTSTLGFEAIGQETSVFSKFGEVVYGISQASQIWLDHQVYEQNGALMFNWDAVADLFPEGLIADMFEAYCSFLERLIVSEEVWQETIRQLIPETQRSQRRTVNATEAPISDALLHELFAAQVQIQPENASVISSVRTLSYQDLFKLSNQVGHRLRHLGASPNQLVAVVMEKGWEQIVAVMGILAAGAAYLPIDPSLPKERLWYLLENGEVEIVLTQSTLDEIIEFPQGLRRICLDTEDLENEETSPLDSIQTPEDLAYVIYTSGSTGLPKGVMISHRGVVNAVTYTNQFFEIDNSDRVLALTALHHDMSVYDIFGILASGGTLIVPEAARRRDPEHWSELMIKEGVTIWNSVPAMMEMLLEYAEDRPGLIPPSLRWVFLGGDWISVTLPQRLKALVESARVVSVGGPTETTLWNIWYPVETVDPNWKSIPYGQPIANTKYYILNPTLNECPTWVAGELCCAGIGLAQGYWRNEEKTHTSFSNHPITGERIYRTGDLGRYLPNGTIEFIGRVDFQIKIQGHRIEAGEIEVALMQHSGIRTAIVEAVRDENKNEKARLIGYIIPSANPAPTGEELGNFLREKLPSYMIPTAFVFLEKLPLSANGKVNRRRLQKTAIAQPLSAAYIPPQNNLEKLIAKIWQEVLSLEKVGIDDNFFDLGGNSLLITKVFGQLRKELPEEGRSLSVVDLFKHPTIGELTAYLNRSTNPDEFKQQSAEIEKRLSLGKNRIKRQLAKSKMPSL